MRAWDESALPPERHCALFETAIGHCGLAWRGDALSHVMLPAAQSEDTLEMLRWASGAEPLAPPWPGFVVEAVTGIQALLRGENVDLAQVPLDWGGISNFERRVYEATRQLPPGATRTYGDLAREMGLPNAARAVGVALGRNPWPLVVPCHRVLAAGGEMGGFSAPGGVATKRRLLAIEAPLARRDGELF